MACMSGIGLILACLFLKVDEFMTGLEHRMVVSSCLTYCYNCPHDGVTIRSRVNSSLPNKSSSNE